MADGPRNRVTDSPDAFACVAAARLADGSQNEIYGHG